MKILHIESGMHLYGGAKQVAYLVHGLRSRGVENIVACPTDSAIASAVASDATVETMPMKGDLDFMMFARIAKVIQKHRPNLVHLHSRRGADLFGAIAANATRSPCVLSRRVDNPEPRFWVAMKYRHYDHVITISEAIRRVLLSEGVSAEKVTCVRSAVDAAPYLKPVDRAAFDATFHVNENDLLVGCVAQLIARKGHRVLIDAVAKLRGEFPNLRVIFFGQGPLRQELERAVSESHLNDVIAFAGFRDDLDRWLGCLDVLAHPATKEGLGVSLLQAQAAGVPVVTTTAGGLPEAVADKLSGFTVAPDDADAFAAALRTLLADKDLRQKMGRAGRDRILKEFSIDAMVEGNIAVYEKILGRR